MQPCLPKELTEIYYTPIPRVGVSQKSKDTDLMSITIVGIQYLYPRLDYESWSNKIGYKNWKGKQNIIN
jgi:hypothetical protein